MRLIDKFYADGELELDEQFHLRIEFESFWDGFIGPGLARYHSRSTQTSITDLTENNLRGIAKELATKLRRGLSQLKGEQQSPAQDCIRNNTYFPDAFVSWFSGPEVASSKKATIINIIDCPVNQQQSAGSDNQNPDSS